MRATTIGGVNAWRLPLGAQSSHGTSSVSVPAGVLSTILRLPATAEEASGLATTEAGVMGYPTAPLRARQP